MATLKDYSTLTKEHMAEINKWLAKEKERNIFESAYDSEWYPTASKSNDYIFMAAKEEQTMTIPNGMNASTVLFLINDNIKGIRVSYDEGGRNKESIKKTFIPDLKVGDHVLVETDTRYNAAVCKVTAVNVEVDLYGSEKIGWIFAKIDLTALDELRKEEEKAVFIISNAERNKLKRELRESILNNCGPELKQLSSFAVTVEHEDEIIPPSAPDPIA